MIRVLVAAAMLLSSAPQVDGNQSWAGIEDNANGATRITAEFIVPAVNDNCGSGATSNAAVWVGLGGVYSNRFAQLGVTLAPESRGAWYELFNKTGDGPVRDVPMDISVGDQLRIRLSFTEDHTGLQLIWNDLSTGERVERDIDRAAQWYSGASAEWIVERSRDTLADFGRLTFTSAYYTDDAGLHTLAPADYEAAIMVGKNYDQRVTRTTVQSPASATVNWLSCG